jgi:lupus La protein
MHASLDQIVSFFQEAGVQLNAVRVRRHQRSRDFKGSVFIEAASVEEAQRVS